MLLLSVRIPRPRGLLLVALALAALLTRSACTQLEISPDGACGNGVTCLNSKWGQCCSLHGYCGDSPEYCGEGCNSAFGNCGLNGGSSTGGSACSYPTALPPAPTCRTTVTGTRWTTQTTTISVTVEETQVYLQTVYSTVTVTTIRATTTKAQGVATPSAAIPGAVKGCKKWYKVKDGESCGAVSDENGIDKDELREWNPNIGSTSDETAICEVGQLSPVRQGKCRIPCGDLWPGYYLCVSA